MTTTRTRTARAALSIRGYLLDHLTGIYTARRTIDAAEALGIIRVGHRRSPAPDLSSWVDQKLNDEIDRILQKIIEKQG